MLNDGLIDEIIVTIFPLVLRDGAPLFSPAAERSQFKTVGCETHETGQIQSRMIKE
jgi:dihydrofolate reductase